MAWPFGKKENQTDEDAKKERDAFIDAIGTSFEAKLEEKLKSIREEVSAVKTKWEALEKAAGSNEEPPPNNEDANLTEEQKRERNRELNDRKMLALTIATNARVTEGEIIGEAIAQGFSEFVPKLKETLATTALERKAQADYPQYCRNCLKYIVGEAAMAGGLRFDGQNKRFFLEDAVGKSGGDHQYDFLAGDMAWTDPRSGNVLSASDQLKKLGIKPEEFAESVKKGVV